MIAANNPGPAGAPAATPSEGAQGGPAAIEIEGLRVNYGPKRAVDSLTMTVPAGSIFGFLGPNGAGKTTTIKALLGLRKPNGG
ncbi:MAG: ATP-binding cassette domain-containing protein, partial [Chloroflexia bacterium]